MDCRRPGCNGRYVGGDTYYACGHHADGGQSAPKLRHRGSGKPPPEKYFAIGALTWGRGNLAAATQFDGQHH